MKTIKIFLASSEELKQERLELADLVENLNHRLSALGLQIQLVKWEYLDSSMGPKHKQEEYNEALRDCEMCLVLYWTRFGDYTTIELDTAYQELCAGHNPQKLYVYFKEGAEPSPELQAFRGSFPTRYGHFYSHFQNADTLKAEFLLQFIDYQKKYLQSSSLVEVKDGQVSVGGKVYVDLKNVPFAGNNEEYNLLLKSIKKTQKLLSITEPDDPEYREYAIELNELKERQKQMENSMWDTALMITQLSTTQCSERLKRAMDLFSQGDNKGALAVLDEEDIDQDINHNLQLIQLGEEGKKGLAINIDEKLFKIKALKTERKEKWYEKVDGLYRKCIVVGRGNLTEQKTSEILFDFGLFLQDQNQFSEAIVIYKEALEIYRRLTEGNPQTYEPDVAATLNNLANLYYKTNCFDESEEMHREALEIRRRLAECNPQTYEPDVAATLNNLALLYSDTQRFDESEEMHREALEIRKRLAEETPRTYEPDMAMTLNNIALLYSDTQRFDESEEMYKEALEIYRRLAEGTPRTYEPDVAMTLNNLANLYSNTQRLNEAEEMYREALEIRRRLAEDNPQAYEPDVAATLNNLALLYSDTQRFDESEEMHREALEIRRRLAEGNPQAYEPDVAATLNNLANLYYKTNCFDESEEMYEEALEIRRCLAEGNPQAYEPDVATTLNNLANLYSNTQRLNEAEEMYREALEIRRRLAEDNPQAYEPDMAATLNNMAILYSDTQRFDESEEMYKEALEIYRRLAEVNPQAYELDMARTLNNLASLYSDTQRFDESEEVYRKVLEIHRRLVENNPQIYEPVLAGTLGNWAFLKNKLGQFNKAEQMSIEALSIDSSQHFLYTNLAAALLLQGKFEEAEAIYREYKDEKKDSFLSDLKEFETIGVIPKERKIDVERIKKMLMEE